MQTAKTKLKGLPQARVEAAIEQIRNGGIVVVVDVENRENEGPHRGSRHDYRRENKLHGKGRPRPHLFGG